MSSRSGHSQAWDPHLWLKVDDTSLKSCRHCDAQEGWLAVTRITLDSGRAGAGAAESRGALRICKRVKAVLSLQKQTEGEASRRSQCKAGRVCQGDLICFRAEGVERGPVPPWSRW